MKTIVAIAALGLMAAPAMAQDIEAGEKVFRKCQACHAVGPDAEAKVGPVLNGVVDRTVAATDYNYSDALAEIGASDTAWTVENLHAFLEKPRDFAKGTKMSFAGLRKEEDRTNLIAYLATFPEGGS